MVPDHSGTQKHNKMSNNSDYGLRENAKEYPMMLVLSFAYPCNALCPHCPYTNSNIRKEYKDMPYMPDDIFKKMDTKPSDFLNTFDKTIKQVSKKYKVPEKELMGYFEKEMLTI